MKKSVTLDSLDSDNKELYTKAKALCLKMIIDLKNGKKPKLEAVKCSLDNAIYDTKLHYLRPGDKVITTELSVNSIKKLTRTIVVLDILLENSLSGYVMSRRELYYLIKSYSKNDKSLKVIDVTDQKETDEIIDFICEMLEILKEQLNVFSSDRGAQTYSKNLIVTEELPNGGFATIDLSSLGTSPYIPKNKPQKLSVKTKKGKLDFILIVESEGTANTLISNGILERHNCVVIGAQGVPSNGVRRWCRILQDQLDVDLFFFGDLDAYTLGSIAKTLLCGSGSSLIRNADYCAPRVKYLGLLPEDVKRYDLSDYKVDVKDPVEYRAIKRAKDALSNDPFFKDKKNKKLRDILDYLVSSETRCEQQSLIGGRIVKDDKQSPLMMEKIIIDKIKKGYYI